MKKINLFLLLSIISFSLFAKTEICSYELDDSSVKVSFTAFKTEKKVGVKGEFLSSKIISSVEKSIEDILINSAFLVDTSSLNTNDKGRDIKILNFFFKNFVSNTNIKGMVKSVNAKEKSLVVSFLMNGNLNDSTLKYKLNGNEFEASGSLNILDWKAKKSLEEINKACSVKHEGKTWPDVDIKIVSKFKKVGC